MTKNGAPGIWATLRTLLRDSRHQMRSGGPRLLGLILLWNAVIVAVAVPLIGWLFRQALRAGGMVALDFGQFRLGWGSGVTAALLLAIGAVAFWLVSLEFTVIIAMLRRSRLGLPFGARALLRDIGQVTRKLLRPSSLPLIGYLFLLLPLSGFGFTTVLARGISVPPFVTGELLKDSTTSVIWTLFVLALAYVNLRLAITIPVFVLTDATGGRSMRTSWRLTRGRAVIPLAAAVIAVLFVAAAAMIALLITALVPTAITDLMAPQHSPLVAALSIGTAQLIMLLITSTVTALIAGILVAFLSRFSSRLPTDLALRRLEPGAPPRLARSAVAAILSGCCVAAAALLGIAALEPMRSLADHPTTDVLAHRGFTAGGVENTICSLEAAAAAGADLVEMDVMQTADGGFVVMHDARLSRLTGRDVAVRDLTLAELTSMTAHAGGMECAIPSLEEYVRRAAELEMPLLIKIKMGGLDAPDHVSSLVDELERLDALESNIYHSLDAASVAELKSLRPDLTVGYIMPFAGGGVPDTPADFIVVEEWSATPTLQGQAKEAGLGFAVWTVNEEVRIREQLRLNTDAIITDRPDLALAARTDMGQESGLAGVLLDALTGFVLVF